ncbi:MAG: hypothetical protein P8X50_06865 [Maritimibacter sp.]|jgi:uncharacterized protein YjiS (DUF1127 family)
MAAYTALREVLAKRALYARTRRELESLPENMVKEDLGFAPFDAKEIAYRAVYGD